MSADGDKKISGDWIGPATGSMTRSRSKTTEKPL